MRLIDADKLESTAVLGMQLQHVDCKYYYFFEEEAIEKAPTIKAIPIEWMYLWRLKNMDKCPADYMPFSDLLNDWEKENEHKKL